MTRRKLVIVLILTIGVLTSSGCSRTLVLIQPETHIQNKKAILVLPGLRNSGKGHRASKEWYGNQGYDTFIPEYVSKEGFDGSVANLHAFIEKHRIDEYEEVYAFVYLMGGWTLNKYLTTHEFPNLKKIVYDRSPLQEQAPRIVMETMPRIIHAVFGVAVEQLRDTPYPTLDKGDRQVGIIVETKATPFVKKHRDELEPISDDAWLPEAFNQEHDDLMYVFLDHDEMYYSFDTIGADLLSFFETGAFTTNATKKSDGRDPFE